MGMDILESMISRALEGVSRRPPTAYARWQAHTTVFFAAEREYYDIIAINHLGVREFFSDSRWCRYRKRTMALLALIAAIIDDGIRSGEFRRLESWKTAVTLWGIMDGVLILEVKKSTALSAYACRPCGARC